ncbi:MAG: cupredoxin domain-containing protein [Nitrospirota bacterium]|nr:cupredoxin domain-containing protein [Nitrospirota bacterium]
MAGHLSRVRTHVSVIALLLAALAASAGDASSQLQLVQQQRIEILIQDGTFLLEKSVPIQVGQTIELIVRNHDPVRHGFVSASLLGLFVSGEDDQIMTYGKGVEGFYVNPGKTLIIRIEAERPGSIPFHCDLHRHERLKGELYVLEVPTA